MKVNPKTLLFEEMTDDEALEMYDEAKRIVLEGKRPNPTPAYISEWMKVSGLDDRQQLLVIGVVVPQRMLISVIEHNVIKRISKTLSD